MKREFEDDDIMYTFDLTYEDVKNMAEGIPVIESGMFVGLYSFLYEQAEHWVFWNIKTEQPDSKEN